MNPDGAALSAHGFDGRTANAASTAEGSDTPTNPSVDPPIDCAVLLSHALDEIWWLRKALAFEARVIEAHKAYATFPKSRRVIAERQVERMRAAVLDIEGAYADIAPQSLRHALADAGVDTLTSWSFAQEVAARSVGGGLSPEPPTNKTGGEL